MDSLIHLSLLGQPDHLAARQQRTMQGNEQAMHMEDGQGMQQHIAATPTPVHIKSQCVAREIAVREHGALAATSRS